MAKKKPKPIEVKTVTCSVCGQQTDYYSTGHRSKPFVDDKNYNRVCFTCFWVPKDEEQLYNKDGTIQETIQLLYSHKHLNTAEELFQMSGGDITLQYAKQCVRAVKEKIKEAGLDGRKKEKPKKRPEANYEFA